MALVMTAAPAAEPIGLAEAKAHLRIDADDEDTLLTALIVAARLFVERTLGLALITQGWSYFSRLLAAKLLRHAADFAGASGRRGHAA